MSGFALRLGRTAWSSLALLLALAAWQGATQAQWLRPVFLPPPAQVLRQFAALWQDGELLRPTLISLFRAFAGLALAVVAGSALGVATARSRLADSVAAPLIAIGFPMPKIALLPAFILWFGIGHVSKIALVAATCIFPMALAVDNAVASLPRVLEWSAATLGAGRGTVLWRVVLPSALPGLLSGIRVALPLALVITFTAEMIGGGGGLGDALIYAQRMFETPTMFAYLLIMLALGLVFDAGYAALRRRLLAWSDENLY